MLRTLADLEDYSIGAIDGPIGQVKDFYFDDEAWVIRYLVVETGTWLSSRKVLIPPVAVGESNWPARLLSVSITRQQVKDSPDIDTDKPVTRQHEATYLEHYDYPCYWNGDGHPYVTTNPTAQLAGLGYGGTSSEYREALAENDRKNAEADAALHRHDDQHLRSCKAIMKYHIHAADGDIGHVQGFLVDEENWSIRYMIVDTTNWWVGHRVLISPHWICGVAWSDFKVSVDLTRNAVKGSPPYSSGSQVDRDEEMGIYRHYRRPGYWAREVQLQNPEFRNIPSAPPARTDDAH